MKCYLLQKASLVLPRRGKNIINLGAALAASYCVADTPIRTKRYALHCRNTFVPTLPTEPIADELLSNRLQSFLLVDTGVKWMRDSRNFMLLRFSLFFRAMEEGWFEFQSVKIRKKTWEIRIMRIVWIMARKISKKRNGGIKIYSNIFRTFCMDFVCWKEEIFPYLYFILLMIRLMLILLSRNFYINEFFCVKINVSNKVIIKRIRCHVPFLKDSYRWMEHVRTARMWNNDTIEKAIRYEVDTTIIKFQRFDSIQARQGLLDGLNWLFRDIM